uniref:Uncharacterized protein n=1 Tax=Triticum urartu TaxID=4572 RepID=A0A8R7PEZ3_TRIUA
MISSMQCGWVLCCSLAPDGVQYVSHIGAARWRACSPSRSHPPSLREHYRQGITSAPVHFHGELCRAWDAGDLARPPRRAALVTCSPDSSQPLFSVPLWSLSASAPVRRRGVDYECRLTLQNVTTPIMML